MTWWGRLLRGRKLEIHLDAELRDHLERQVADYVAAGMKEPEARRRASIELGGIEQVKESCRDARGTRWLDELAQDLRYGLRTLRKSPVFTLVAVLSLALGIGANTAIFSLLDRLVLRALPVREPERLVRLEGGGWTNPIWEQVRDRQSQLFEAAVAWSDEHVQFDLAPGGPADLVDGLWASGDFFSVLGVPAILGRTFGPEDDRRGGAPSGPVAVISYRFWQRRFGGAPDVTGRTLTVNQVPFTIVGVTPPEFFGPTIGQSFDVALPIGTEPLMRGRESWLDNRSAWWLEVMARLKPGQTIDAAIRTLQGVQPQIREATLPLGVPAEHLEGFLKEGLRLIPATSAASEARRRFERPLLTLMAVVGLVLLLACANLANLLLARADARRHELVLRLTLGASRFRLARQLLTESLLLAGLGAVLGLAFARWASQLLVGQLAAPDSAVFLDLALDGRVLGFTAAVATGTALLFGIAPAFRARGTDASQSLKEQGSRGIAGEGRRALSSPLVVFQVALSLVLVVAAGLFVRTFATLAHRNVGFDRASLLVVTIDGRRSALGAAERAGVFARAVEAARGVPGVAHAAASSLTPVSGMGWNSAFEVGDRPDQPPRSERDRLAWVNAVSPGWFATYGTRLLAGRDFDAHDREGAPAIAIVNEAFARKYLDGATPVGRIVRRASRPGRPTSSIEIVGLVEDAAYRSIREPLPPTVYLPMAQIPSDELAPFANIGVRPSGVAGALLAKEVVAAIGAVDGSLSLTVRSLAGLVDVALAKERIVALLSGFFGGLALLLAGIGLYGVASYAVGRRRAEIGIRMALGADAARVVRLVLGRVAALVALGLVAGALLSLWAGRFVGALLYGLEPRDPATLLGAALVLATVAALAAWGPARRAARIDPAQVLREG